MFKRFLCSALACVMLCAPLVVNAAEARSHTVHNYVNKVVTDERETGGTAHYFIYGIDASNGEVEYRTCNVTYITEYYTKQCNYPGCDATYGSYTNDMKYHSSCGQGYVD